MAWRCDNCNRVKLLGIGWLSEHGKSWCPTCKRDWDADRAQVRSSIEEMRGEVERYSSGKMALPPRFASASAALAEFGLQHIDRWLEASEERLRFPNYSFRQYLREHLEHEVKPLVARILGALNEIKSRDTSVNVNDLIQLCLQLTEMEEIITPKYPAAIDFPVDVLIHVGAADRTTTLQQLRAIASQCNTDPRVRAACIIACGRMGDQQAVEPLVSVLEEEKELPQSYLPEDECAVLAAAACALIDLDHQRAVTPILEALRGRCLPHERDCIDYIVGRMTALVRPGTPVHRKLCSTWKRLEEAVTATDPDWREHNWEPVYFPAQREHNWELLSFLERVLMGCGGPEAVQVAAEWARSEENHVALTGTKALSNLEYEEALDVLCSIVATSRRVIVRRYATGDDSFGIPDYGPNTEQRIAAAEALAQRGGPKAKATLQSAASDEDAKVREVIRQVLSDL